MRYITAGESHGPQLTVILEGVPAGLTLAAEHINKELLRRQKGHGRGRRMQIETDTVEIVSGVRQVTLGSHHVNRKNDDFKHWTKVMGAEPISEKESKDMKRTITKPPGHADLNGAIKYGHRDIRNVLERSSARETTVRVAAGAVAKQILKELGVEIAGHVLEIGGVKAKHISNLSIEEIQTITENSPVRCLDKEVEQEMMNAIDHAKVAEIQSRSIVEVIAEGMPIGVGSYVHYDRKLDAKLAGAIMSINAFKGAEIGVGFEAARQPGSKVHDEILWDEEQGYTRKTNNAGGLEGGMTTECQLS